MNSLANFLSGPHADSHTIMAVQLLTRAVLVFFAALALLRVSGPRTFGGSTAFDMVAKIILGAILSRAVVVTSSFGGTLLTGLLFILLHRGLAWEACCYNWVAKLVKSQVYVLAENS